ncbi:MAG: ATP-binding protein [Actinomycetota bacterium]
MTVRPAPWRFRVFLGTLVAAAGLLVGFAWNDAPHSGRRLLLWSGFVGLLVLAEVLVLLFHRTDARLGLSLAEAVVLTMLIGLTWAEVVTAVATAFVLISITHRRLGPVKAVFNIASPTVAAAVAAGLTMYATTAFSDALVFRLAIAAVATALYALTTHLNVAAAISLTEGERFFNLAVRIPQATVVMIGSGILLGLHFAAAYAATSWTLLLFPFALIVISMGYSAVVLQDQERQRVQSLHEAGRALAVTPDLGEGLTGFLQAAARATSAIGASALIEVDGQLEKTSVYADEPTAVRTPVASGYLPRLLALMKEVGRPVIDFADLPERFAPLRQDLGARSFVAVPIKDVDQVVGCILVLDRAGASEFDDADARLLEALANDLSLTLGSRRLFDQVVEERERFQLLVESVRDYAIYMLDPQGNVVSWNAGAERIFGYKAGQIVGGHFSRFYPSGEATAWMEELSIAAREGRLETTGSRVRADGSIFLANAVTSPVRDASGELRGFAKVTRDITALVAAQEEKASLEAQLHQSQRLESIGQLAGGVAHDFNNIISVISNCATFVLDELEEWELEGNKRGVIDDTKEILQASDRAASLTRQLLVFSRRDVIEPTILNMNDVIRNLENLLRRAVGTQVEVTLDLDPEIDLVRADSGQMEQILLNLAINARDAMEGEGRLSIRTRQVDLLESDTDAALERRSGPHVELCVSDSGPGMAPDVVERAFDPFFTTKPKGQGTGLGLATVYGIVKGAGGRVTIESAPGQGATFVIHLPVDPEPEELGADQSVSAAAADALHGNERILVVEDEDPVRTVTARILENAGYEVLQAANAPEALSMILAGGERLDLLLTDVLMPGMSGIELAEEVAREAPGLRVIFMSAYAESMAGSRGAGHAEAPLVQKPFDRPTLLAQVRQVLDG